MMTEERPAFRNVGPTAAAQGNSPWMRPLRARDLLPKAERAALTNAEQLLLNGQRYLPNEPEPWELAGADAQTFTRMMKCPCTQPRPCVRPSSHMGAPEPAHSAAYAAEPACNPGFHAAFAAPSETAFEAAFEAVPEPAFNAAPEPAFDVAPESAFDVAPEPAFNAAPEPAFDVAPAPAFNVAPAPACETDPECTADWEKNPPPDLAGDPVVSPLPSVDDEPEESDEDAMPTDRMAAPATVPILPPVCAKTNTKGWAWLFSVLALLSLAVILLWQFGVLGSILPK